MQIKIIDPKDFRKNFDTEAECVTGIAFSRIPEQECDEGKEGFTASVFHAGSCSRKNLEDAVSTYIAALALTIFKRNSDRMDFATVIAAKTFEKIDEGTYATEVVESRVIKGDE